MNSEGKLCIDLSIAVESWREVIEKPKYIAVNAAQAAFRVGAISRDRNAEAAVRLTDDAEILALNRDFRDEAKPTNVLSFPALNADDLARLPIHAPLVLGDVVIALETMLKEAKAEHKTPEDHLSHLVIHGILHLLGHDHKTENEAELMEQLEVAILEGLGVKNPYANAKYPIVMA